MSDAEHELIVDTEELREQLARVVAIARRALDAAAGAQDTASGRHDEWIDEARRELAAS